MNERTTLCVTHLRAFCSPDQMVVSDCSNEWKTKFEAAFRHDVELQATNEHIFQSEISLHKTEEYFSFYFLKIVVNFSLNFLSLHLQNLIRFSLIFLCPLGTEKVD